MRWQTLFIMSDVCAALTGGVGARTVTLRMGEFCAVLFGEEIKKVSHTGALTAKKLHAFEME